MEKKLFTTFKPEHETIQVGNRDLKSVQRVGNVVVAGNVNDEIANVTLQNLLQAPEMLQNRISFS